MSWEDELLAYLSRKDVKVAIHQHVVAARKAGVRFGGGNGGANDEEEARAIVEKQIIPQLEAAVTARIPSMEKGMFLAVPSPAVTADGSYEFSISFDPKAVMRDSLYEGALNDVVAYISHGAKPLRHWVAGYWLSSRMVRRGYVGAQGLYYFIPEGYKREADPFLVNAVNDINRQYSSMGVTISLEDAYKSAG